MGGRSLAGTGRAAARRVPARPGPGAAVTKRAVLNPNSRSSGPGRGAAAGQELPARPAPWPAGHPGGGHGQELTEPPRLGSFGLGWSLLARELVGVSQLDGFNYCQLIEAAAIGRTDRAGRRPGNGV